MGYAVREKWEVEQGGGARSGLLIVEKLIW